MAGWYFAETDAERHAKVAARVVDEAEYEEQRALKRLEEAKLEQKGFEDECQELFGSVHKAVCEYEPAARLGDRCATELAEARKAHVAASEALARLRRELVCC
jgi:hypothetical protein